MFFYFEDILKTLRCRNIQLRNMHREDTIKRNDIFAVLEVLAVWDLRPVFHILDLLIVICNNLSAVQHPDKDAMILVTDHGKAIDVFDGKFL
jgi:hypothetical protein